MKYRVLSMIILVFLVINWFVTPVYSETPKYLNFAQIHFFYSEKMDRCIIFAFSTDESTKCGKLDWDNIYMIVKDKRDRRIIIDNDKLEVLCISKNGLFPKKSSLLGRINIIIDNSGSLDDERLKVIEKQLVDFVNEIPIGFEVQVIKFSDTIQLKSGFSSDKQFLTKQIKSKYPRGNCALWDAMEYGVQELVAGSGTYPFLLEIVLTAGKDTGSKISMEEFKNNVILKCEENSVLLIDLVLIDGTEPLFIFDINSNIFALQKISYFTERNSSIPSNSNLHFSLSFLLFFLENPYIFIFPNVIKFDDIKAIYLARKQEEGKIETIQDFYTNPVNEINYLFFWIFKNLFKATGVSIDEFKPPIKPPMQKIEKKYIINLSFMDSLTKSSMLDTELRDILDEAVLSGMKAAQRVRDDLLINEQDHTIANADRNVNQLVDIIFYPNRTKDEKINQIISDMMTPNSVDVIVTGQYVDDVANPLISIRPLTILKWSQKIVTKNLQFNRVDLICRHPQSGKRMLCKNAFDEIAKAVQELLEEI